MGHKISGAYICPACQATFKSNQETEEQVTRHLNKVECLNGHSYEIHTKIPDFTFPKNLSESDRQAREDYDAMADQYEIYAPLPFLTYEVDEWDTRRAMIEDLHLDSSSVVLEIGCGTGRSSQLIAQKIQAGKLFLQEIAPKILQKAGENLANFHNIEFSLANGSYLPFTDDFFDASHHFGGLNTFSDIPRCLSELARVTKPGGRVVVGDEGMAPWLRNTQFGKIMMNSNPLLQHHPPIKDLPVTARNVKVEWIVKGAFYALSFTVGEGEPTANYHLKIPSKRGGSHWSRYYGNLEGVTDEAKQMAQKAQLKRGISMHQWLDEIVREAANRELKATDK